MTGIPTKQGTERLYENYDDLIIKCVLNYNKIMQIIADNVDSDRDTVLDIGIGTGNLEEVIFKKFPQTKIIGIDTAADFLNIAKNNNNAHQLQTVQADIRNYEMGECRFGKIFSSLTIHHFEDKEKRRLFKNIYKALNDKGMFINFDMINPEFEDEVIKLRKRLFQRWEAQGLSKGFIEEEKKEMAERDKLVELSKQKKWLEKIGFIFKIIYEDGFFCVYLCEK